MRWPYWNLECVPSWLKVGDAAQGNCFTQLDWGARAAGLRDLAARQIILFSE